jgi:putative spermidine/putrescine transport system ATP-binding protein
MSAATVSSRASAVRFVEVSRYFGEVKAVDQVNLEVYDGEFFSMLGPSGSGKTTCLRLIAGFEQPTSGRIELYGQDITGVPPFQRDVNTVFQDYALFPHMNVEDNVGYGLMVKGQNRRQRAAAIAEMLEVVQLPGYQSRKPSQLSGGQRQRVALARALINQPRVLLLDEPLGALDLKLRQQMQIELKSIQHRLGVTFIFVTHDQEEALSMSDRIAVFNRGQIEQVGTPAEIYEQPATPFVAGFVGTSNLYSGEEARQVVGRDGTFAIRPEKIHVMAEDAAVPPGTQSVSGTVSEVSYLGVNTRFDIDLDTGSKMTVLEQNLRRGSIGVTAARGRRVMLVWQPEDCRALKDQGAP